MDPPTLMAEAVWVPAFVLKSARFTPEGKFRIEFCSRPGLTYSIEYRDSLNEGEWHTFVTNGSFVATDTSSAFDDDFTSNTSAVRRQPANVPTDSNPATVSNTV